MQQYFFERVDDLVRELHGGEVLLCTLQAERTQFVRFNRSRVRQPGTVDQAYLQLRLVRGARHASLELSLGGRAADDLARGRQVLTTLRGYLDAVPEDPHLHYAQDTQTIEQTDQDELPAIDEVLAAVDVAGTGRDLVGIYAAGPIHAGFASSLGKRAFYTSHSFNFDWSFYLDRDRAVKCGYAGRRFDRPIFEQRVQQAQEHLELLARPTRTIEPGRYAAYLAPAAVNELLSLLCWGAFGLKAQRTRQTPLIRMFTEGAQLHDAVTLREHTAGGVAPSFDLASGFAKPDSLTLIEHGRYKDALVSARSAREYDVAPTGAAPDEGPESLELDAGRLAQAHVLARIERGIYISNLWYLNYSARSTCRITGMTRFATFWVEGGQIVAPLQVMRFDAPLYDILGSQLVGLTRERDQILDPHTYGRRATRSSLVPGALVDDFALTL